MFDENIVLCLFFLIIHLKNQRGDSQQMEKVLILNHLFPK